MRDTRNADHVTRTSTRRCARVWLLGLLGAAWAASLGAQGRPLTLEALFDGPAFRSRKPENVHWARDSRSFVYREPDGAEGGTWWREGVNGHKTLLADWSSLRDLLRTARPRFVQPPLDDVNASDKSRYEKAVSPDAERVVGPEAGDLYLLDLGTGQTRFLTDDPVPELFPQWSPDGSRIAFVKQGDLWLIDPADGRTQRLTDRGGARAVLNGIADWAYEEELKIERSFWWSPDGRRLLFVQYDTSPVTVYPLLDELATPPVLERQRYPKAGEANARVKLGVVDVEGGATRFVDLGSAPDFYLARAGFSPDGTRVWYQWLSRDQRRLELRVADPQTGAWRTVLVEEADTWINVRDDLTFVDPERFLWTSERDGWRHLYLYGLDGRVQQRLTRGRWQVEKVYGLDARRTRVFFQATEKDPRERHVYVVALDGTGLVRLSREDGHHDAALAPDGRHYVDTFSDRRTPPRLALHAQDGTRLRMVADGAPPGAAQHVLLPIEFGSLAADDGTPLFTGMIRPPKFDPRRRYPVVLYVYGGPHAQTVQDEWGSGVTLFLRYLAEQGLIVFWLDNRGSWGRGHAFEAAVHRRLGEVELRDQLVGVRHLKSLPYVDGTRIGVYGGSYGGFMTLTALLRSPETFRAGVAYAPVTDWRFYDTIYTERYMSTPRGNAEGYRVSAPLTWASSLRAPLLLIHGTLDNNVHPQNTVQLADALRRAGRRFELMMYPRVRHNLRTSPAKLDFHRRVSEFLFEQLLGSAPRVPATPR